MFFFGGGIPAQWFCWFYHQALKTVDVQIYKPIDCLETFSVFSCTNIFVESFNTFELYGGASS